MTTSLKQAIESLGQDTEQVYQTLKAHDIKGVRGRSRSCPVGKYLTQATGQETHVGNWTAFHGPLYENHDSINLPGHVMAFVQNFDWGLYPDLEVPK